MMEFSLMELGMAAGGVVLLAVLGFFFMSGPSIPRKRLERVINRRAAFSATKTHKDELSLRRRSDEGAIPFLYKILNLLPSQASLKSRLEKAGLTIQADLYVLLTVSAAIVIAMMLVMMKKPVIIAIIVGFFIGIMIPRFYVNLRGAKRLKSFLRQFPEAIDFIVRGLRSGLPVTESMNMVGAEMDQPIAGIFSEIGESVRLGVSLEKALTDTAKKLNSTEFNFFVTSLILQRETGGNLSEILENLSEVLRKRFMMKMKIKAMSSEARASAMIVGSLPFLVVGALYFISPEYLNPLFEDRRGHMAVAGAGFSLFMGIGIMIKMAKFEI